MPEVRHLHGRRYMRAASVIRLFAAVTAFCVVGLSTASAQYFGRNKVQYKSFDFQVLKTENFDIYYYPSASDGINIAARLAERWHTRLSRLLDHSLRGRQPLVLYGSHIDFEQTNIIPSQLGEGTGGVTEPLRRRIIMPLGGPLADTDHVLGHELVHAFQFDITTSPQMAPGQSGIERLPLWFIEGMAEYLSIGPVDAQTAMWLRDAARRDALPEIKDLNNPEYFPYRWGHAFWAYVGGRWGDGVIAPLLANAAVTSDPDAAFQRVLGMDAATLSAEWHAAVRSAYGPVLTSTTPPDEAGARGVGRAALGGDVNVGPSLSPDGRLLAFLSERSLFSIDLFVADAATGKVLHRLTSTATDSHYNSLQFIQSSGGWDSASERLAVGTVVGGGAAVSIFNGRTGKRERDLKVAEADEVFNPVWSPDGRSICFSGMTRGVIDLFTIDVGSGTVTQLTRDAFAELQPAWSPDGRVIAFTTDRFSSNLDTLQIGDYQIGLLEVASGDVRRLANAGGNALNAQWADEGRNIYFVSSRDGVPNLYRAAVDGSETTQLTNLMTGISGITDRSPAMSVAPGTRMAAYSVFDNTRYDIYLRPLDQTLPARVVRPDARAAILPPLDRRASAVQAALDAPQAGLPAEETFPSEPYKPRLSVESIGQPTLAVGTDRFGAFVGGGLSASFSDLLGNHTLVGGIQLNSGINGGTSFADTAAQIGYLNRSRRWNWGLVGGQMPYLSGGYQSSLVEIDGEPIQIDQSILFRQTERSAAAILTYPFSRTKRLEFQGGATQMAFSQSIRTQAYSLITGELLADQTDTQRVGESLLLANSSVAFVSDSSTFGATSPVQGERFRFEAAPTFGTVNVTTLLADYRRYLMPAPFYTIAARVMHYGRYGTGGQDGRFFPLYLGYPDLVRGYNINSLDFSDCLANSISGCPAFQRLSGSRLLVGNLEFRFPLLRPFTGAARSMYGPVPVEVAFFLDGGVAWNRGQRPSIFGGSREGVSSTGVTLRASLFGFAIGEFDFSRPLQRTGRGWIFQFNLSPGF